MEGARLGRLLLVVLLVAAASGPPAAAAPGGDGPVVHERRTLHRTPEATDSVEVTYAYDVPDTVTDLAVTLPTERLAGFEVVSVDGFRRTGEGRFDWQGTSAPSIRVRIPAAATIAGPAAGPQVAVERPGWAIVTTLVLDAGVEWRYTGTKPHFETETDVAGPGYVTGELAYLGPHRTVRDGRADAPVTVVVSNASSPAAPPARVAAFLGRVQSRFPLGRSDEPTTVFVLPNESFAPTAPLGDAADRTVRIRDADFETATVDDPPAHEFVHTRLGDVGEGELRWLREASAMYYGVLLSLNDGVDSYARFQGLLEAGRSAGAYRDVVLAEPSTFRGNDGDYAVGLLVLASLDAQIRRRSNGSATLADVYRHGYAETDDGETVVAFESYDAFRRAVVEESGDPAMGPWLDRYAQTTERPDVPDDPARFVTNGSLDPDGDGAASAAEVEAGTNPFATPTPDDGGGDGAATGDGGTGAGGAEGTTAAGTADRPASEDGGGGDAPAADGGSASALALAMVGLWLLAGLATAAAVTVWAARPLRRLTGHGAWLADRSAGPLVGVAVAAIGLSLVLAVFVT